MGIAYSRRNLGDPGVDVPLYDYTPRKHMRMLEKVVTWIKGGEGLSFYWDFGASEVYLKKETTVTRAGDSPPTTAEQHAMNKRSQRPLWMPISFKDPTETRAYNTVLTLHVVTFDNNVRNMGFGRRLTNVLQQTLTRASDPATQWLEITTCHLPIFYTVDTHYGWLIVPDEDNVPDNATPGEIFPRFWPAESPAQKRENEKAIHAYANLLWCTPVVGGMNRAKVMLDDSEWPAMFAMLRDMNKYFAAEGPYTSVAVALFPLAHAGLKLYCMPVGDLFHSTRQRHVADAIARHCVDLGNSDTVPRAVVLLNDSIAESDIGAQKDALLVVLAFLIDHARVMFRPLVISLSLHAALCRAFNVSSLQDMFLGHDAMPRPAPFFTQVDADCVIWVPVKKPHMVSDYSCDHVVPLPEREPETLVVEEYTTENDDDDEEEARPAKRPRVATTDACLSCAARVTERISPLLFCSSQCQTAYYHT